MRPGAYRTKDGTIVRVRETQTGYWITSPDGSESFVPKAAA